ncbi:MAG: glycosyltransferase family 4 protein [Vicinamibacterales bacterium]
MRILYCATDQRVPGHVGGSAHVEGVASGLAALGHDVHVATTPGDGPRDDRVSWHAVHAPLNRPQLRLLRASAIRRLVRALQPHVIMERYHNFGGEGVVAAVLEHVPVVLEVNAPVIDYPGSPKARIDRWLLVEPLRRWRDWQCRHSALLVTPSRVIVPSWLPASRVLEIEWGADVERFRPDAGGTPPYERRPGETVAVFAGAFRAWHGAHQLAHAARVLQEAGRPLHVVFIGDGPELARVRQAAAGSGRVTFTGPLPHDAMPAALAGADIGVAPFDVAAHPPLQLAFYWSPLKIFEYMASGLAVVAPRLDRLTQLVGHDQEGILYDPNGPEALAEAIVRASEPGRLPRLREAARARAVADFSWQAHCARLGAALQVLARVS